MSRCKKCGFENKEGSKFCGHCGAPLKTRSSGKGIIIGVICIVLAAAGITVAALFLAGRNQQRDTEQTEEMAEESDQKEAIENEGEETSDTTDEQEEETVEPPIFSKRIWDYDGTIYTSYDLNITDWTSLTGDYHDTFIVYHDNIYLRKTNSTDDATRVLVRRDMTGKETVIAEDVNPLYGLVIYANHLYYVALDSNMQSEGKIVNLSDLSVTDSEDYQIKAADADTWILCGIKGEEGGQLFQCDPGFENIKKLDITKDTFMGISDGKIYFQTQEDEKYNVQMYDVKSGDITSVLDGWKEPAVLSGSDLFYAEKTKNGTTLHRMELGATGDVYDYSLKNIDVYMNGSFYEADNKVYVIRFLEGNEENNTEMIALDLQSGTYESIGLWTNTEVQNTATQNTVNARYQAYVEKIKEEEKKYGTVKVENEDSYACMSGVCFIDLVDFANNGNEQLLIAHQNENRECEYEIWSWENGQMVLLNTGDLFSMDGGVREVMYSHANGQTYLITGWMDDVIEYGYCGYSGDTFGLVYETTMDMEADEAEMYRVNGKVVSESDYDEADEKWFADVTEYNLSYDCDSILELMEEVKDKLNS